MTLARPDYEFSVEEPVRGAARSAEQWARAVFEDAPLVLRWIIRVAWQAFLGARLGPRSSPEHVLGMPILRDEPGLLVLDLPSALIGAHNVVDVGESRVRWVTLVRYERPLARVIWPVAAVIHQRVLPYLLRRASRRS